MDGEKMRRVRLIILGIVVLLVLIVIFQNMTPVSAKMLFITVTMPIAAHLFIATVAGVVIGFLVGYLRRTKK